MQPPRQIVFPPPRKSSVGRVDHFAEQLAIEQRHDRAERRRTLTAVLVVCVGVGVAACALWQARTARTVYVLVPMNSAETTPPPPRTPYVASETIQVNWDAAPPPAARFVPQAAAPVAPQTWTPPPAPTAPPIDYAARDRQIASLKRRIEDIDETIRRVRADPHWQGFIKNSTYTARQQSSDAYLADLDRQRNELRRQKWALEGR